MKELKLDDYPKIKPYLDLANYEGYNSNFVTMIMWNHEYHIQYEIHEHYLIMLHNYKGTYFWSMPFTTEEYYQESIDYMIEYSKKHHFDFMIDCAIEEFVNKIKEIDNGKLLYQRTPFNDDYIYDRHILETLSGKKMQKRRNHFNAFQKQYPQYVYRELDEIKDFDAVLNCFYQWEKEKDSLSESITSEIYGIMNLLSNHSKLNFKVGGIFIDEVMQAFIIASRLNHQTIQIHVEKANKKIRGLYPAILKEFLEHHYSDDLYINREEDMGLDNLKKSKLALHPIKMIHKYRITLKNFSIQQASDHDKEDIIQLWKDSFSDENEETTQFYFQKIFKNENTYLLRNNNELISVCQIIPYHMMINDKEKIYYFIEGVCTKKEYEGQKCMSYLLTRVLQYNKYKNQCIYLQAYNPQIYRHLGFYISHYHQIVEVEKEYYQNKNNIQIKETTSQDLLYLYNTYMKNFDEYRIRDINYYEQYFIPRTQIFHQKIMIFEKEHKIIGYILYEKKNESIHIYELIYINAIDDILSYICQNSKKVIIECDIKIEIHGKKEILHAMMSHQLNEDRCEEQYFINEVY